MRVFTVFDVALYGNYLLIFSPFMVSRQFVVSLAGFHSVLPGYN